MAILGGFLAALSWATATLASSRTSRMIGPLSVLGWVMAVGWFAAVGPALLSPPVDLDPGKVIGIVIVGLSHNVGLLLAYAALSMGRVSIVAPITATEGALAAILSVLLGEPLAITTAILLAVIALGVVLAAVERSADRPESPIDPPGHNRRAAILAMAAALTFSVGLVGSGRLGAAGVPPAWIMLASRSIGVLIIVLPLVLTRRFRLTRPALPLVVLAGVLEVFGGAIYIVAATEDIAVAAVLSSQFAAIAAVAAYFLFHERLQRLQVAGVVLIAVGITLLSALGG
ncbi:MAG TPA: EamA family transporter [Candidatus Limnocylindrales bacterium]|nr:EamA family transporter [Candidatus Limnocylindrales bacterium]